MSGPQCCENPPTLDPSSGAGHVEQLGGLDAYVVGSQDSKLAVILLSDIFGYEAPNFRKLADKVAAAGFYVVAPDYFYGDSYDPGNAERPIPVWVKDHGVESGYDDTLPVIQALKSKGISRIGAAGFCWGGKGVVELGKRELIQAGALLHPAVVTTDDIKGVKVPIAVLGAEIDENAPPELLKQFEEVLSAKPEARKPIALDLCMSIPSDESVIVPDAKLFEKLMALYMFNKQNIGLEMIKFLLVDGFVKVYPKTTHGWTVRYKDNDEAAAMEAQSDMIQWFVKYVK